MSGTVNISRDIWDDKAFKPEPLTEREAWMWMVMEASYKDRAKPAGKIWVELKRGQLACSVRFMCGAWSWSKSRVDRFLKRLENRDMIGVENGTGINVITICKYDENQNRPKSSGTDKCESRDSSGTAAGQQRDKHNKGVMQDVMQVKEDTNVSHACVSQEAFDLFIASAERSGWPVPKKLSAPRRKSINARLKDCGGMDGWRSALARADSSEFLSTANWFGIDWMIKPANFTKLVEGNYDNRSNPSGPTNPGGNGGHAAIYEGFAQFANSEPDPSGSDQGGNTSAYHSGGSEMDCGPGGNASQPVLRIIGSE